MEFIVLRALLTVVLGSTDFSKFLACLSFRARSLKSYPGSSDTIGLGKSHIPKAHDGRDLKNPTLQRHHYIVLRFSHEAS